MSHWRKISMPTLVCYRLPPARSLLGSTTGALLVLLLPGLAALFSPTGGLLRRGSGVLLAVAGAACCAASAMRLALYPAPHD